MTVMSGTYVSIDPTPITPRMPPSSRARDSAAINSLSGDPGRRQPVLERSEELQLSDIEICFPHLISDGLFELESSFDGIWT